MEKDKVKIERFEGNFAHGQLLKYMVDLGFEHFDSIDTADATDQQKETFAKWHYHLDDEVRFCVSTDQDNPAVFGFKNESGEEKTFAPQPGDLLMIPAKTVHNFKGCGRFFRFFSGEPSWTAYFP